MKIEVNQYPWSPWSEEVLAVLVKDGEEARLEIWSRDGEILEVVDLDLEE